MTSTQGNGEPMTTYYALEITGPDYEDYVDGLDYPQAVQALETECIELDETGWTVERGWASSGNYAAAKASKGNQVRMLAIEIDEQ